ncbi:hypothetical protein TL16_g07840 [Triparma laevis f. inornata]|uniref:Uncharacterized protein n=1 Tax=Triparma laevis f. inornata TaxID=1714386 RepID=A0A9W7AVH0_9STRA|nr:hypothetical protein TL16_g07840 [Triparma laevis f. inornata]
MDTKMDHSEFQDDDDEFLKSLRMLRGQIDDEKMDTSSLNPFTPSKSLARSPTASIDPDAARVTAENLMLSSKVEKLSSELSTAKASVVTLKQKVQKASSSPKRGNKTPTPTHKTPTQTPTPLSPNSSSLPNPPNSSKIMNKLRSEKNALLKQVDTVEVERNKASSALSEAQKKWSAEKASLEKRLSEAVTRCDRSEAMSASIGKRDAEFAAQLNKVREDFEVERDGLRRSIASITAANENSKRLKKESAEARDAAMANLFKIKSQSEENFNRAVAAEGKCKVLLEERRKVSGQATQSMQKELKRLKEDNEEVGEELKQAMGEVERLRAEVNKNESVGKTSAATSAALQGEVEKLKAKDDGNKFEHEKLKKEVLIGKKQLQKEMLRLNKIVKEKEDKIGTVQRELEGVMEAMEAGVKVELEKAKKELEDAAELKEELELATAEVSKLRKGVEEAKAKAGEAAGEVSKLRKEVEEAKAKAGEAMGTIVRLGREVDEAKSLKDVGADNAADVAELKEELELATAEVAKLRKEIQGKSEGDGVELKEAKEKLEKAIVDVAMLRTEAEAKDSAAGVEVAEVKEELELATAEVVKLRKEIEALKIGASFFGTEVTEVKEELELATAEVAKLRKESEANKSNVTQLKQASSTIDELTTAGEKMQGECKVLEEDMAELKDELECATSETLKLRKKLGEGMGGGGAGLELASAKAENVRLKAEVDELKKGRPKSRGGGGGLELASAKAENVRLKAEIEELKKQAPKSDGGGLELASAKAENTRLKAEAKAATQLKEELRKLTETVRSNEAASEKAIKEISDDLTETREELLQAEDYVASQKEEIGKLKAAMKGAEEEGGGSRASRTRRPK